MWHQPAPRYTGHYWHVPRGEAIIHCHPAEELKSQYSHYLEQNRSSYQSNGADLRRECASWLSQGLSPVR